MKKHKNTRKLRNGGKTFASHKPVEIYYNDKKIMCDICKHHIYDEIIGTLGKSKVRSGMVEFAFGEIGEVLDTTSIIVYVCKQCGNCRTIRNSDDNKMSIITKEV
jgi:hypothetical protein